MKVKLLSTLLLCTFISFNTLAQERKVRDVTTKPDDYYLKESETPNSLKLLPPPPDVTNIQFLYDRAQYEWGKMQRNTPRGEQAYRDARISGDEMATTFSEAFGIELTKENTPEIHKLVKNMREDAGELGTRHAKEHYMRVRPYVLFNEDTCRPEDQHGLSGNGSYPSGHTATGWAIALVLAEINPYRQDEILERGYQMGVSRVICGYHFQSDVDAGRLTASATVARLHANEEFNSQLAKAKKEFGKLLKKGMIKVD